MGWQRYKGPRGEVEALQVNRENDGDLHWIGGGGRAPGVSLYQEMDGTYMNTPNGTAYWDDYVVRQGGTYWAAEQAEFESQYEAL